MINADSTNKPQIPTITITPPSENPKSLEKIATEAVAKHSKGHQEYLEPLTKVMKDAVENTWTFQSYGPSKR